MPPPDPTSLIPPPPPMVPPTTTRSSKPDYVYALHSSSNIALVAHTYEAFDFPAHAEDFVGLWGTIGRLERRLQNLGPIFVGSQ